MSSQNTFKMKIFPSKPIQGNIFSRDNFPQPKNLAPFVESDGALVFICGNCDHILLNNVRPRQITQAIYKCPKCGSYNQINKNS
ncbi:hypothetical protein JW865_01045 [Candidatus Bathyarchaeota archaeon]|nr:hypothetical protein [Candidatus Bathyarchaeota archaeon]